jgi:hypothetical protein
MIHLCISQSWPAVSPWGIQIIWWLEDVDVNLHSLLPPMNRLNQPEPATLTLLSFLRSLGTLYFSLFYMTNLWQWGRQLHGTRKSSMDSCSWNGRSIEVDSFKMLEILFFSILSYGELQMTETTTDKESSGRLRCRQIPVYISEILMTKYLSCSIYFYFLTNELDIPK